MNRIKIAFILFLFSFSLQVNAQSPEDVDTYVERFKQIAIQEQVTYGIPAAITLAQGIHESACGLSELATQANNHFGIKCKNTWKGETYLHDDDAPKECFRKYPSAEHSFRDHSVFLKDNNRYHFLFDIEVTDYKAWASGLKRAGYATNPAYVSRLTNLIEKYNLQQYTYEALNKTYGTPKEVVPEQDNSAASVSKSATTSTPTVPESSPIHSAPSAQYFKGLQGFWAKKGDVLTQKAVDYNIRYPRLLMLNDLADAPLEHDQFIFIEKKRKVGTNEYHIVREGEDMQSIAQVEALMIEFLYQYNNMKPGQEPAVGERLNLQYRSLETPRFMSPTAVVNPAAEIEQRKTTSVVTEAPKVKERAVEVQNEVLPEVKKEERVIVQEIPVVEKEAVAEMTIVEEKPSVNTKTETMSTTTASSGVIIDPEKAKKVEELLATDNKREVDALAEEQRKEQEEKERLEKEMMERIRKNDEYSKSVTAKIDADRKQIEARQDEEIKKRRAMEEEERKRIEEEQVERDRIEALQAAKAEEQEKKIVDEKARLQAEENARAQQEANRIAQEKAEQEKAERMRLDEEAKRKRKYNEPGISDSTKNLKKKYDNITYRTLPERKPLFPSVKDSVIPAPRTPNQTKPTKPSTPATTNKTVPTPPSGTNKVVKTNTGIKREVNDKKKDQVKEDIKPASKKGKVAEDKKEALSKNGKNKKDDLKKGEKKVDKKGNDKKDAGKKGKEEVKDSKKKTDKTKKSEPAKKTKK